MKIALIFLGGLAVISALVNVEDRRDQRRQRDYEMQLMLYQMQKKKKKG